MPKRFPEGLRRRSDTHAGDVKSADCPASCISEAGLWDRTHQHELEEGIVNSVSSTALTELRELHNRGQVRALNPAQSRTRPDERRPPTCGFSEPFGICGLSPRGRTYENMSSKDPYRSTTETRCD